MLLSISEISARRTWAGHPTACFLAGHGMMPSLRRGCPLLLPFPPGTDPEMLSTQGTRREEASVTSSGTRPDRSRGPKDLPSPTGFALTTLLAAWHRTADTLSFLQDHPPIIAVSLPRFLRAVNSRGGLKPLRVITFCLQAESVHRPLLVGISSRVVSIIWVPLHTLVITAHSAGIEMPSGLETMPKQAP